MIALAPPPDDAALRGLAERWVEEARGAIAIARIDGDSVRYVCAGGADENTIFEAGSITKTMTAALLADAVARGEVALNDRLDRFIASAPPVTLEELATHTSGLPRLALDGRAFVSILVHPRDPYRGVTIDGLVRALRSERPRPGTFAYSNFGFAALGVAIAGDRYAEKVRERVLLPMGMPSSFVEVPPELRARVAVGHDLNGDETPSWSLGPYVAAGGVKTTARDLAEYLRAVRDGRIDRSVTTPRRPAGKHGDVGLAWLIERVEGDELVWHNGGTGGFRSYAGFLRKARTGVVVLSSAARDVDPLGRHALGLAAAPTAPGPPALLRALALLPIFSVGRVVWGVRSDRSRAQLLSAALVVFAMLAFTWHRAAWSPRALRMAVTAVCVVAAAYAVARSRVFPWWPAARRRAMVSVALSSTIALAFIGLALIDQ